MKTGLSSSLLLLLALAVAPRVLAQVYGSGTTAGLTLGGFVPPVLSLSMSQTPRAVWRSLASAPQNDIEIARIVEVNNFFGTYRLTIESVNHGALQPTGAAPGGQTPLTYSVSYNGSAIDLSSGQSLIASSPRESGTTTTHLLKLHLNAPSGSFDPASLADGRAHDTITFSIAAP